MATDTTTKEVHRRKLSGVVVADSMNKTVIVAVTRYVKHPKYKKFQKLVKRFKAHSPENAWKVGDRVRIEECRPISKDKHFTVIDGIKPSAAGE